MRNIFVFFACLLISASSSLAQIKPTPVQGNRLVQTQNRQIGSFGKLRVSMGIETIITDEQPGQIHLEAESSILPYVVTQLKGDTLVLTSSAGQPLVDILSIKVRIGIAKLDAIQVDTGAILISTKEIVSPQLNCNVSFGGELTSKIAAGSFVMSLQKGAKANLSGQVETAQLSLLTGSKLNGEALAVNKCNIKLDGGCQALLAVDKALTTSADGISRLQYVGQPSLTSQATGQSVIERISKK